MVVYLPTAVSVRSNESPRAAAADRLDDLRVAGAAADVAAERVLDRLGVVRAAVRDVALGGEHHPGRAEAALRGVVVDERLLDRREALGCAEPLDRRDLAAVRVGDGEEARAARLAVDEHRAGAAAALVAAGLRAR